MITLSNRLKVRQYYLVLQKREEDSEMLGNFSIYNNSKCPEKNDVNPV